MMIFHQYKLDVARGILESMNPKPKVIVELGGYVGNSAVAWGAMLKEIHANDEAAMKECKVFSCELESDFIRIARDFVDLAGLNDTVEIVQGPAAETLKKLQDERRLKSIDMLFIDHWEKFYVSDLKVCEELGLLRPGCVVIADNTDIPGAPDYLKYVQKGGSGEESKVAYESKTYQTTSEKGVPVSESHLSRIELVPDFLR
jgi:catechol O-methyltransferase